jgi:hypothetical protein
MKKTAATTPNVKATTIAKFLGVFVWYDASNSELG